MFNESDIQPVSFELKLIPETNVREVSGFGFSAEIREGSRVNKAGQSELVYSVLFPNQVIALSQTELRKYIMFLELVEFYLQELNS